MGCCLRQVKSRAEASVQPWEVGAVVTAGHSPPAPFPVSCSQALPVLMRAPVPMGPTLKHKRAGGQAGRQPEMNRAPGKEQNREGRSGREGGGVCVCVCWGRGEDRRLVCAEAVKEPGAEGRRHRVGLERRQPAAWMGLQHLLRHLLSQLGKAPQASPSQKHRSVCSGSSSSQGCLSCCPQPPWAGHF